MAMTELAPRETNPGYDITGKVIADVSDMPREEWLKLRRHYLGASEVAAVLGLSKYKSAFGVWSDKVNGSEELENIHIEFGNWMEPHIRAEFPKRFKKYEGIDILVMAYPFMLHHPLHEFMSVNLDGIVIHPERGTGVIEIKTAGEMQWKEWQDDDLPDAYYCQIQQELHITGLSYAYVVALVGKRLLWKFIPRNDEFIASMTKILVEFWNNHIITKEAPLPAGYADDAKILKDLYYSEDAGKVAEMHQYQTDYDRYKELTVNIKELQMEQEAIKQKFMQTMGTAEIGFIGNKKVTWKTTHRKGYTVEPTSFRAMRVY